MGQHARAHARTCASKCEHAQTGVGVHDFVRASVLPCVSSFSKFHTVGGRGLLRQLTHILSRACR
eukprot:2767734-Alexandrium_andersonii.AAC.1